MPFSTYTNPFNIWAVAGTIVAPSQAKIEEGWIAERPPFEHENWWHNRVDNLLFEFNRGKGRGFLSYPGAGSLVDNDWNETATNEFARSMVSSLNCRAFAPNSLIVASRHVISENAYTLVMGYNAPPPEDTSNITIELHAITGDIDHEGDLNTGGDANVSGDLNVDLDAIILGEVSAGSLDVSGAAFIDGSTTINGNVNITGSSFVYNTLSIRGSRSKARDGSLNRAGVGTDVLAVDSVGGIVDLDLSVTGNYKLEGIIAFGVGNAAGFQFQIQTEAGTIDSDSFYKIEIYQEDTDTLIDTIVARGSDSPVVSNAAADATRYYCVISGSILVTVANAQVSLYWGTLNTDPNGTTIQLGSYLKYDHMLSV